MVLPLLYRPLSALSRLDLPLVAFWSAYLALWPGVMWWWTRL